MTVGKIPINVPEPLYLRLQRISALANRSVEEILTSAVTVALPPSPDLPPGVADELAEMMWLSDQALWDATTPTFTAEEQARLAELNDLEDTRPLHIAEQEEQAQLLAAYERSVLRRGQAFAILSRRGHQLQSNRISEG